MTHRQRKVRQRRGQGTARSKVLLGFSLVLAVCVIVGLSAIGWVISVAASAPDIKDLKPIDKGASSVIYAADGSRLGYVASEQVRTPIRWDDMPVTMRQATVSIEDKRYYEHGGYDPEGIGRSIIKNVTSGKALQGGSTITQQLVRALYIKDPKRDLKRKIREAKMAEELEQQHSKTWILHEYMNDVPYGTVGGRTAIGIEAAAETYFGKHAKDLHLAESALLAGLPQAPSQYNPLQNPSAALDRRNEVLKAMADSGYITATQAEKAMEAPLRLHPGHLYTQRREPYFFDYVQEQLIERYGAGVYRQGGLKVYTTVDPKLQEAGRKAIAGQLPYQSDPSSAIVSIDPKTGYIRAMASSGHYRDRTFNLAAQGHRQPGSTFKVMVLTAAIREGINPASTTYVSKPLALNVPGFGVWNVKTYDGTYGGAMNLVQATLKSDNSVYAQLDVDVGPKKVAETAHLLGIKTKLDAVPSEGLGGLRLGVSPLELANAYATLAAGGVRSEPQAIKKVVFRDGKVDDIGKPRRKRVLTDGQAYEVTKILEMNIQKGTGTHANFGCPAAGKTGTTDNFNDAWFVGYTPDLASAVWVGYPNKLVEMRSVHGIEVAGGTFPAGIWHDYMNVAHGSDCNSFPQPKTRVSFSSFYGQHSANGQKSSSGGYYGGTGNTGTTGGTGGTGGGTGGTGGYDPRLYAAPPQRAPQTQAPPAPQGGTGGGGGGGGNGGGGGGGTGGNGGAGTGGGGGGTGANGNGQ
jgi:penicillin-binding protein 1A